jgi:hypothetical protein
MATLGVVLSAFEATQSRRSEREISIGATKFLSFTGVTDVVQQKEYATFIKTSTATKLFRYVCNEDYCNYPGGIASIFNFNLTVLTSKLEKVRIQTGAVIISPETFRNSGSEADIAENLDLQFKAGATPNKEKDFTSFKRRKSKKEFYSEKTLDKYASELERDVLKLIESKNLSKNENLQNELLNDVLRRLGNRVGSNESSDISSKILSYIRDLIKDMREHGINDMEQIRLLEGIALAVSGDISNAKIVKATRLSKRRVEYGLKLRKEFSKESVKVRAEISCVNDGANSDEGLRERLYGKAVNENEIENISNRVS